MKDFTQEELNKIAAGRYWKQKRNRILIELLVIVNLCGFALLGLYVTGNFPAKPSDEIYRVSSNQVVTRDTIEVILRDNLLRDNQLFINGVEMTKQKPEPKGIDYQRIAFTAMGALMIGYSLYHLSKAKKFGNELMESWVQSEKVSGQ